MGDVMTLNIASSGNLPVSNRQPVNTESGAKKAPMTQEEKDRAIELAQLGEDMFTGLGVGITAELGILTTGSSTYLHEHAHAAAVNAFYNNSKVSVQVDGIENLQKLIREPSLENFTNLLSGHDINKDGAAGVTKYDYGTGMTTLGESLGKDGARAIICAAGSVAEEIPVLGTFALGYMLKKKSPKIGYAMMALAGIHHIANSSYPFTAMSAAYANRPGHDWANFAKITGVHPLVTAVSFAATLPILGAAMYAIEKAGQKENQRGMSLSLMIRNGEIPPDELKACYDKFPGKKKIETAQQNLENIVKSSRGELKNNPEQREKVKQAMIALEKEQKAFGKYLIETNKGKVDKAIEKLPAKPAVTMKESLSGFKDGIKASFRKDATGTVLNTGALAGSVALTGVGTAHATAAAAGSEIAASIAPALGVFASGVSAVGSLASIWNAGKTLKNPDAGKIDKTAAVSTALFSSLATAGALVPGLGLPAVITGVAGVLGTQAAKFIAHKFA
jgi:hypothetical protein